MSCGCGCGEPTPRRFRPGHDAKLKGRLTEQTRDPRWWIRERAVKAMVEGGWGRWVDRTILATTPIRSRYRGRFVETRHIESLQGCVLDAEGTSHSVWFCPAARNPEGSNGRWVKGGPTGWICSVCIHLADYTEIVNRPEYGIRQDAPTYLDPTPKTPPRRPKATRRPEHLDPEWLDLLAACHADLDEAA